MLEIRELSCRQRAGVGNILLNHHNIRVSYQNLYTRQIPSGLTSSARKTGLAPTSNPSLGNRSCHCITAVSVFQLVHPGFTNIRTDRRPVCPVPKAPVPNTRACLSATVRQAIRSTNRRESVNVSIKPLTVWDKITRLGDKQSPHTA